MKIRLKFKKEGPVKFVGHLDTMRLFQRAVKVAQIPVAYSQGFSPHSLVYFALPLAVGMSSTGEYMDIITEEDMEPVVAKERLNAVLVDGIEMLDAFEVVDQKDSLMSLVQGADYEIKIYKTDVITADLIETKLNAPELVVLKKGKKGIKPVDIKPLIRSCEVAEFDDVIDIRIQVFAGSTQNLNPDLFVKALLQDVTETYEMEVCRRELYALVDDEFVSINTFGRNS